MIHSFNLNKEEEELFQKIVEKEINKSESAIIRERIFRRRDRHQLKLPVIDMKFLSQVSNLISSIHDNLNRGHDIHEELRELKELIDEKMSQE